MLMFDDHEGVEGELESERCLLFKWEIWAEGWGDASAFLRFHVDIRYHATDKDKKAVIQTRNSLLSDPLKKGLPAKSRYSTPFSWRISSVDKNVSKDEFIPSKMSPIPSQLQACTNTLTLNQIETWSKWLLNCHAAFRFHFVSSTDRACRRRACLACKCASLLGVEGL